MSEDAAAERPQEGMEAQEAPRRTGWKRLWRRLETSAPVLRMKRAIRTRLGTEIPSRVEVRSRTERFGGWWICPDRVHPGGVAYCFGIGEDLEFERQLVTRYGLRVFAFDPTPSTVQWIEGQQLPSPLEYLQLGLADYDGAARFRAPRHGRGFHSMVEKHAQTGESVEVEVRRLPTLMRQLRHDHIDVLKMDIEGTEYDVIDDLITSGVRPGQILVEFHHRFPSIGNQRTEAALAALDSYGYAIAQVAPSGREYVFVPRDSSIG